MMRVSTYTASLIVSHESYMKVSMKMQTKKWAVNQTLHDPYCECCSLTLNRPMENFVFFIKDSFYPRNFFTLLIYYFTISFPPYSTNSMALPDMCYITIYCMEYSMALPDMCYITIYCMEYSMALPDMCYITILQNQNIKSTQFPYQWVTPTCYLCFESI